ncbi:MAG: hypothetical protein WDN69_02095 [Aliidongia sp.]
MLKKVASPPAWLDVPSIECVHSVSGCVSEDFFDYIPLWRHNGWWRFDTPSILKNIVEEQVLNPESFTLFYYEAFEQEYDAEDNEWQPIRPEPSFPTAVVPPSTMHLSGYDVVTFSVHNAPECSPLSCNMLAQTLVANRFCLFENFESAYDAVAGGKFDDSEPGPYRVIAVYAVRPD